MGVLDLLATLRSPRPRRTLALLLLGLASAVLAAGALRPDLPFAESLVMARRFWSAGPTTRLLNAPYFARDPEVAREALALARRLPLDVDVALVVAAATPPEPAERMRRQAAYLLAPRRVHLVRGPSPGRRFVPLEPAGARP